MDAIPREVMTQLVIGYGNTLRCDDGVGQSVAAAVATWALPAVVVRSCHQLTPELAAEIAEVERVIFIDVFPVCNEMPWEPLRVIPVEPEEGTGAMGHHLTPQRLLALTQALYGCCPAALWVLVPGMNFEFGETFSPLAASRHTEAIATLKPLLMP
jgi:hydrogenase maturation protease